MIADALDDVAQISLRVEPIEFRRADQAVDCSGSLTTGVGACEQIAFSAKGHCTQRSLTTVVVDFYFAISGKTRECLRTRQRITDRNREFGFSRDLRERVIEPAIQRVEQRTGAGLTDL